MREFEADPSHPRYHSLWLRHKLELAQHAGMLANSAMIAHGRGEAFDYLLGKKQPILQDMPQKLQRQNCKMQ